ncbi:MAG: D-alanyl-D-alanine carboxypeptidase/D-alanyl-D-alanine-endopeptidase [bacterium]
MKKTNFVFKIIIFLFYLIHPFTYPPIHLLTILSNIYASPANASQYDPIKLRDLLNKSLLDQAVKNAKVGIKIKSLRTGKVLYEHNADRLFNPASNMKLLTTAAALFYLKPEYTFKTEVYQEGSLKNGLLNGNLYLKGNGDPSLVYEELWDIAQLVANKGISVINGDIVGDDNFFDKKNTCTGWKDIDGEKWYNPRLSALSLNFNTISVYIKPGIEIGDPLQIKLNPPTDFIKINNITKTKQTKNKKLTVKRLFSNNENNIVLRGYMPLGQDEIRYIRNIESPPMYTLTVFKELLKNCGVNIKGEIRICPVPPSALEIVTHESRYLSVIIKYMNKISNNFIAEQILKTLGAELYNPPGNTSNGLRSINNFLEKELKEDSTRYKIVDGSGLSPENKISPDLLINVLEYICQRFEYKYEFISSLSVCGIDGTMQKRLVNTAAERRVRAKSGRLKNVSSLSGYLTTQDNEELIFSILVNNLDKDVETVKLWQDKIILALTTTTIL